jgi:hypothetical protein
MKTMARKRSIWNRPILALARDLIIVGFAIWLLVGPALPRLVDYLANSF